MIILYFLCCLLIFIQITEEKNDLSAKYNQILTEKKTLEDEFFNISAQLAQFKDNTSTTTFQNSK